MYLTKQGKVFYAVLEVPKDVRAIIGKTSFRKTLKTTDKWQAQQLARPFIQKWKEEIRIARLSPEERLELQNEMLTEEFKKLNKSKEAAKTDDELEGLNDYEIALETQALDTVLKDYGVTDAEQLTSSEQKESVNIYNLITGKFVRFSQHIDDHLQDLNVELKTKDSKKRQILRFAEKVRLTKDVNRHTVRDYIRFLSKEENLSNNTIKRDLTNLSVYWEYLRDEQRVVPSELANPFKNQKLPSENRKEAAIDARIAFSVEDICQLHKVLKEKASQGDRGFEDLLDCFTIAIYTGARREEIGGLKRKHFSKKGTIKVENAKTKAGNREVPIHPQLAHLIEKRLSVLNIERATPDDFLFPGLGTAKYGKRTDALGKRFGRIKSSLGFDKRYVFHSIRKTVSTLMEQAGIAEGIAADILGHDKPSITYGLYSGGASMEQKHTAIRAIKYDLS